ncbi:Lid2 complex component snt2 Short=Lid2C component snt2 [Serendipita indica DSM 11827]|nr:Lid2 complex component snt2 Short=Lid2C component snt2 [Serendipita indica DSM 11827]
MATITEGVLKSGEKVFVNDYVYAAAAWERRDPVPYSIGRIIEFIPPEDPANAPMVRSNGRPKEIGLRVRMAWFYRPQDVQDKGVGDHRLLLAALFSEIVPFSNVRGKCIVRHKDKIADLAAYKKKDDRFYFHQLFDPFTKDQYEVIPSTDIHNLPSHIKEVLVSRYEFVVCEREAVPDLQDNLRLCETCGDWCPGPESVMCELCKKHYHMECVNPPLLAKPSRGYGWSCASCNNKRDSNEVDVGTSKIRQTRDLALALAKARAKSKPSPKSEEEPEKFWKGWNFRYFGQYTVAEDTLDPDDMIYVRAPTRIGPKFQVVPPPLPEGPNTDPELPSRGGDDTIEVMSLFCRMDEAYSTDAERRKSILTARSDLQCDIDWLEEVVRRFTDAWLNKQSVYSVNMRKPMVIRAFKDGKETRYRDREWSEVEEAIFDESVRKHHSELRHVRADIKTRTMPEVVRHFGHWKARQLKLQRLMPPQEPTPAATSDDNTSIYQKGDRRVFTCAVCRTKDSETWWKAPRNLSTNSMCDECGTQWRKYAIKSVRTDKEREVAPKPHSHATPEPPTTRSGAATNKAIGLAADKAKRESTPLNGPLNKKLRLVRRPGLKDKSSNVASAASLFMQASCVGAPLEDALPNWMCDICANERNPESNLDPKCELCPPHPADRKKGARDSAFLRAAKPTEFRGWVHVLCSTFTSQLEYADARRMRLVEGLITIPERNFTQKCSCCGGAEGCVSQCDQCLTTFHPVCAWNHGYKFGIEFTPVKPNQRKEFPTVEFRQEIGTMNAVIICDSHGGNMNPSGKKIYDLCDLDERGRTALQAFTETYKQAHNSEKTYGLLRKARRLDDVVPAPRFDAVPTLDPSLVLSTNNQCVFCHTLSSPFWWPTDAAHIDPIPEGPKEGNETLTNGTTSHPVDEHPHAEQGDVAMDEDAPEPKPAEAPKVQKICHACYFQQLTAKAQPIVVDLSSPIIVS